MAHETFENLGEDRSVPAISDYLSHVASLPFTQSYVRDSIVALNLSAGDTLADIGCGVAHDALQMCESVAPGGSVLFLDHDESLLAVARTQVAALRNSVDTEFRNADVLQLDLPDCSVDGARIVRALQHVKDPKKGLSEMLRVVRLGKRVVAIEPDWSTFTVSPGEVVSQILQEQISTGIRSPYIGGQMQSYLEELGASHVDSKTLTMSFETLAEAEKVFLLEHKLAEAQSAGRLDDGSIATWRAAVEQASATGDFSCSIDLLLVTAVK